MMTWRFIVWLFFLFSAILAAHLKLRVFPHLIILFLILIPIYSILFLFITKRKLKIELNAQQHFVERGQIATWQLQLHNQSTFLPMHLRFTDHHQKSFSITLNPKQSTSFSLSKLSVHTGSLSVPLFDLELYDAFNLFRIGLYLNQQEDVLVLPLLSTSYDLIDIGPNLVNDVRQALLSNASEQDELQSIKELQHGDSMRRIHWNLSARLNQWYVRHDSQGPQPIIEFIVFPQSVENITELEYQQRDKFLDLAAIQVDSFLKQRLSLNLNSIHVQRTDDARILLSQLELVHKNTITQYFSPRPHSLYVVFTENLSRVLVETLSELRNKDNHVLLFVFNQNQDQQLIKMAEYRQLHLLQGVKQNEA